MVGKGADNKPLQGHRHAEFLAWWENGLPTRLLVWRAGRLFDEDEQVAILRAAKRDVSWAAAGADASEWKVRLVPLDVAVPPPPGFDGVRASTWESLTPYVPPRHHLRGGKQRELEALPLQIRRELGERGIPRSDEVQVVEFGLPEWVAVHIPRRRDTPRAFLGNRRGYRLRLSFAEPVAGPVRLGHSSTFGLGLFRPIE